MRIARRQRLLALPVVFGIACLVTASTTYAASGSSSVGSKHAGTKLKTHLGSYLAGRVARGRNDTTNAVEFYRRTLVRSPNNIRVIQSAFLIEATEGNRQKAASLARRLVKNNKSHQLAQLWLGIDAFNNGRLNEADKHFKAAYSGPVGELTSSLAQAWVALAKGKKNDAYALLKSSKQADWSDFYLRYHRALIADVMGDQKTARSNYQRIFSVDSRTPRTTAAYIRHAVRYGQYRLAGQTARTHIRKSSSNGHEAIRYLFKKIKAGERLPLIVNTPEAGLAEVFYGLGEALTSEGGVSLGTIYLQMALVLKPDFPFALAALANVYESTKRYDRAIGTYNRIPKGTALQASIDIRKAVNLNSMDRVDDAKAVLDALAAKHPKDIRSLEAVGNILRSRKRYREAIDYYTRVLALLPKEEKRHWTYWYARGTSYERIKNWPKAEKDLLKAMELDPDQALILNYLGYSWVDQKVNLERGLKLIEKAVSLKPDDGYIVDSLGWAHFRLGNFDKAVKHLERAVELRPEDPVLNDHLGDALWQVGREREARYQWEQALTLKPEAKDEVKIRQKLVSGLPRSKKQAATLRQGEKAKRKGPGKRVEMTVRPGRSSPAVRQ